MAAEVMTDDFTARIEMTIGAVSHVDAASWFMSWLRDALDDDQIVLKVSDAAGNEWHFLANDRPPADWFVTNKQVHMVSTQREADGTWTAFCRCRRYQTAGHETGGAARTAGQAHLDEENAS